GQITQIYVHSGDKVKAGAPLMQIDPVKQQATVGTEEANRASKQANLRYAQQQFERTKALYAAGVASKQSYDEAQAALEAAQADLNSLESKVQQEQAQLRYYRVAALTSGVVGDIPVRVGDRVTDTTVLTTVDQGGGLEAYVSVPVERAPDLHSGLPLQLLDSTGSAIENTRLNFVSPQADDPTQSVLVKAPVSDNKGFRSSQF